MGNIERNVHKKVLEMCDCYLDTDYRAKIQKMTTEPSGNVEEDAVKYLALSLLLAMTEKARTLSFKEKKGDLRVTVKGEEKNALPEPSPAVFSKVFDVAREILHIEGGKGKSLLSLGLKNGQLDVMVKLEDEGGGKRAIKIDFDGEE